MRIKQVRIPLSADVYAIASEEARKAGFTCVGTKIRHDVERYYRKIATRRMREERK